MSQFKVLVTCPPMIGMIDSFKEKAKNLGIELNPAKLKQTLSEEELIQLLPVFDGWIIGDDPATKKVFEAGRAGLLKAAVKWGIGTDNVDFNACKALDIPIANTPGMFGSEVADIALGYVIGLARYTFSIDKEIKKGNWPKPSGISLKGKKVAIIGYGDIGKNTVRRLLACQMDVFVYDPFAEKSSIENRVSLQEWPLKLDECDFIVVNCSLSKSSYHLLNTDSFKKMKKGVRIINVGRGPIIDENALIEALDKKIVHSVALDVFENEPLPLNSPLRNYENCIFGSHNSSNTIEGVFRTSFKTIDIMSEFLKS